MYSIKLQLIAGLVLVLPGTLSAQVDPRGTLPHRTGYPAPGTLREYPGARQAIAMTEAILSIKK